MSQEESVGSRVDLHSHLVPGVDDGARTLDDVLEGVGRMVDCGIRRIATTPHLEGSLTHDPAGLARRLDRMDEAFAPVRAEVQRRWPEVELSRANEVALDHPEPDLSDSRIRLSGARFVLVEWPRLRVPAGSVEMLERLQDQDVSLLLAHPERYRGPEPELSQLEEWRGAGAFFQVNFGSLAGAYGPDPRRRALELLARGWVDCLATDFHGRPSLRLYVVEARQQFARIEGDAGGRRWEAWQLLTRTNPARVLDGEPPVPVPPVGRGETLWSRVTSLFG